MYGYPPPRPHHVAPVLHQGSTKVRRWDIPWGNNVRVEKRKDKGADKDKKITRTLKVLPDAAANAEESDCFRVMRWLAVWWMRDDGIGRAGGGVAFCVVSPENQPIVVFSIFVTYRPLPNCCPEPPIIVTCLSRVFSHRQQCEERRLSTHPREVSEVKER